MLQRILAILLLACGASSAAFLRIEVSERSDVLNGRRFGTAGPYERIVGRAYFAVDPKLAANRAVVDIELAPRNAAGQVEFSAGIYVLKPRDPAHGNGAVLFEVLNRGNKLMPGLFLEGASGANTDLRTSAQFGDAFLLDRGYTLVWLGWQFDVPRRAGLMRLDAPVISGVTGLVRAEFVPDRKELRMSLADRGHVPYPIADAQDAAKMLTVRDQPTGERRAIGRDRWRFVDGNSVVSSDGFEPGKIYEVVYRAKDPVVAGLGGAGIRDLISFLKYGGGSATTVLGDQSRFIKRAYGFGASQSGRYLRSFLYDGFNADEKDRKVFDALLVHIGGAGRGGFNHRFAQPSRSVHLFPTRLFPFTDLENDDTDGPRDGLLSRAQKMNVVPKIFYTHSSWEYWGSGAALTHVMPQGDQDAPLAETTRMYLLASTQHGAAPFPPPRGSGQNLQNPNTHRYAMRALLVAMDKWVAQDKEPPPSRIPSLADATLAPLDALQFPRIPDVSLPRWPAVVYRLDHDREPPKVGRAFPVLLPQVDADGNERGGVRMPEIEVPLGTFTGWNLRGRDLGAPGELYTLLGSWIPFARTEIEREKSGDPRPSIEKRYRSQKEFLAKVDASAKRLMKEGFLLPQDVARVLARAAAEWDWLSQQRAGL